MYLTTHIDGIAQANIATSFKNHLKWLKENAQDTLLYFFILFGENEILEPVDLK